MVRLGVFCEERGGGGADAAAKLRGREHFHVRAAGEDAALDVVEMVHAKAGGQAAIRTFVELLRGVPGAFAEVGRDFAVDEDADFVLAIADEAAEGAGERSLDFVAFGRRETAAGGAQVLDACEQEVTAGFSHHIVRDQHPAAIEPRQVQRVHDARFGGGVGLRLLIDDPHLAVAMDRLEEIGKVTVLGVGGGIVGREEQILQRVDRERDGAADDGRDFLQCGRERLPQGRAAPRGKRVAGEREGERLVGVDAQERKQRMIVVAIVTPARRIPHDRDAEAVAHELDVALDGAGRDAEFARERFGVERLVVPQPFVQTNDPFQRGAAAPPRRLCAAHAGQRGGELGERGHRSRLETANVKRGLLR